MVSHTDSRWQLGFAAVQAFGAIVGVVGYFLAPSSSLWIRLVWLMLTVALAGVCVTWFVNVQKRSLDNPDAEQEQPTPIRDAQQPLFVGSRIHYLVPLTVWSAFASMVAIYETSDLTALLLVALAPLWIGVLVLGATKVSRHRASGIAMAVLFCGLYGAWLGSGGDSGARLGFTWYSLAGVPRRTCVGRPRQNRKRRCSRHLYWPVCPRHGTRYGSRLLTSTDTSVRLYSKRIALLRL